jgi:hypothetical protein
VPGLTINIEYGSKFAPLSVGNEGFLPGMDIDNVSVNDFKKYVMIDHSSNPSTVLATVNYTTLYNSYNLPGSTTVNVEGSNQVNNLKYTYQ